MAKDSSKSTEGDAEKKNFFEWIIGLFVGAGDPEREKKRLLKEIGKDLGRARYKFYKARGSLALPALAKFFFDTYKVVHDASTLLQGAAGSQALKDMMLEGAFSEQQRTWRSGFEEAQIREWSQTMDPKLLGNKLKDDMVNFFSSFDTNTIRKINDSYVNLLKFLNLVNYDFYFFLKKFDSTFQEGNVSSTPKFDNLNGEYISDDIKDFLEILLAIEHGIDWDPIFDALKHYKGVEVINRQLWSRLTNAFRNIVSSDVLPMMVRHIDEDPYWKPMVNVPNTRIVESYLDKLKKQTETVVTRIMQEKKNAKVDKLCQMVFGAQPTPRMKFYTEKANLMFSKKMLTGFIYTTPINYLKTFLLDYYKKDIRDLEDLLLVRGKWSTNMMSQQMSDTYYRVLAVTDELLEFDDNLNDEGEIGSKLKRAVGRVVDKDPSTSKGVQLIVKEINDSAAKLINDAASYLISFGKHLKSLIEDYDRANHQLIINWKEITAISEAPIKGRMADAYKRIYYFIQLMQIYSKPQQKTAPVDI